MNLKSGYLSFLVLTNVALLSVSSELIFAHGDQSDHHSHGADRSTPSETSMSVVIPTEKEKSSETIEVSERLSEAVSLTAKGNLDEARIIYESVANDFPDSGLPALARFYRLTSTKQELLSFLESMVTTEDISPLTKARTLVQASQASSAVDYLLSLRNAEAEAASSPGLDGETVLYLSSLLDRQGDSNAATENALEFMKSDPGTGEALDLALYLSNRIDTLEHPDMTGMLETFGEVFEQNKTGFETVSTVLDQMVVNFTNSDGYFLNRPKVVENAMVAGSFSRQFVSRLLLAEGDPYTSLEVLEAGSDPAAPESWLDAQISRESIIRHNAVGEYEKADEIRMALDQHEAESADAFIGFLAVRTALQQEDMEKAREFIKKVDPARLNSSDRHDYHLTNLRLVSDAGELDAVIDQFESYFETYEITNLDLAGQIIFGEVLNTSQHLELEDLIRDRFENNPESTDPVLWLLAAEAAKESRLKPNELEAKYQYILARPSDVTTLQALVDEAVPIAVDLQKAPLEELEAFGIPVEEPDRLLRLADATTQALIKAKPYAPEPLRRRMELLRGTESPDEDVAAVVDIVGINTNNSRILGNSGYVLATEGFPEKAIGYYEKALGIAPEDLKIRFNLASCHTRLGRWDEATDFYKHGLETGFRGKEWHLHEFVQRLWAIANTLGTKESMLEYFHDVTKRSDIPWQSEMISDIIAVMIIEGDFDEARKFQDTLVTIATESDDEYEYRTLARTYQTIASGFAGQQNYDESRNTLEEGINFFADNEEIIASLRRNLATLWVEAGESAKAIDILVDIGTETDLPDASDSFYFAATIAENDGDVTRAAQLYKMFLDSESRSFALRRRASSRLNTIMVNP